MVRKLKQYLVQEKRGSSSQKKADPKGKETKMKTLSVPTLVEKRRRSCSESDANAKRNQEHEEQQKQSPDRATFRNRSQTMSCSSYFEEDAATMKDRVLTENAKKLSPEQLHALEMDIFKPLDFYEILFEKMKAEDKAEADYGISSCHWSLLTVRLNRLEHLTSL